MGGEGWEAQPAAEYDCNAGFENWVKGWSIPKKQWCCQKVGKGCVGSGAQTMDQAASQGFGAGAQYGDHGAPVAAITGIVPAAVGRCPRVVRAEHSMDSVGAALADNRFCAQTKAT